MRIFLNPAGTDKRVPVPDVEGSDTIEDVKRKGKASDPQLQFVYHGKVIRSGVPMSEYNVQEDAVLKQAIAITVLLDKRHKILVDLEWTVDFFRGVVLEQLDLPEAADLHFFLGRDKLDDNECSLASAGVTAGKPLRAISQVLAQRCGEESKVRKSGFMDAVHGAVGTDDDGEGDEVSAASLSQPFPLDCPFLELAELGPGWPLFFEFGLFLAVACAGVFILNLPVMAIFANSSGMQQWPASSHKAMEWTILLSAGNLGPQGSETVLPGWCSHVGCATLLILVILYTRRQKWLRKDLDRNQVEPMDYAIFLSGTTGVAEDFWRDEARVQHFVETCLGNDKAAKIEVVQVVLGYDVPQLKSFLKQWQLLSQGEAAEDDAASPLLPVRSDLSKEELQNILTNPDSLRSQLTCHPCCVVVLRLPKDQQKILETWETPWNEILWLLRNASSAAAALGWTEQEFFFNEYSRLPLIDDKYPVRIYRATDPSDMMWENFGASSLDCLIARLKTHMVLAVVFAVGLFILWAVEASTGGRLGGNFWQMTLRISALISVNGAASSLAKRKSAEEFHLTRTDQDDSLMVKLALYMSFNYTVLLLFLYWQPGENWYCTGGLLTTICMLMPTDTICISVLAAIGVGSRLSKMVREAFSPQNPTEVPGMTQTQLNKMFEPVEMNIARPFAHLVKSYIMCLFFMPFWPLGSLWMVLSLVLKTLGYKVQLLRHSKRPYRQSHLIAFSALRFAYLGAFVYALSAWWFLAPSLRGRGKAALTVMTPFLAVAALFFTAAPRSLAESIASRLYHCFNFNNFNRLILKDGGDPDYYEVQRLLSKEQKYHMASPPYQQLVRAMQAQKTVPPWDADGNIPEPGSVGSA